MKTRFSTCFRKPDFARLPKIRFQNPPQKPISNASPKPDFKCLPTTRFHRTPQNPVSRDFWYVEYVIASHSIGTHHNIIRRLHYNHKHCGPVRIRPHHMVDSSKVCVHLCWLKPQKLWLRTLGGNIPFVIHRSVSIPHPVPHAGATLLDLQKSLALAT